MKTFLVALIAVAGIALGSDYLLGGPMLDSGGILVDASSAKAHISPNVRLDD